MILDKTLKILKNKIPAENLDYMKNISLNKLGDLNNKRVSFLNELYEKLPDLGEFKLNFSSANEILVNGNLCDEKLRLIEESLQSLKPWRKGPFKIFNIKVDGEWRSDIKWDRLKPYYDLLNKKSVLDIGSGNGYYSLRMVEHEPDFILSIEPFLWNYFQFSFIDKYLDQKKAAVLPLRIEELPQPFRKFDVIFSMGVLYHRKSPYEHLEHLFELLNNKGTLFLETLVKEGEDESMIFPEKRYACMKNVWFIPTISLLKKWIQRAGFKQSNIIDISWTTSLEQRETEWMPGKSLKDFLMPENNHLTVEGYQAPLRALLKISK